MGKVVFFSNAESGVKGRELRKMIKSLIPAHNFESFQTLEGLIYRLRRLLSVVDITILSISSFEQLEKLVSHDRLLEGIRVILILPDLRRDTISLGHRLRPRFMTDADGDFSQVEAVLRKMLGYELQK